MRHPLQQGLRHIQNSRQGDLNVSPSATSITTRIKTVVLKLILEPIKLVQVRHPLQQGLRL